MPRTRVKLTLLLAGLLTVPALLLVAEGCVRLLARTIDPLEVFVSNPQLRADTQGEHTSGMFEFDPLLTWRLKPNLKSSWWDFTAVDTNSAHLRMDREVSPEPGLRVVCLGDSVTFGYRVPLVRDKSRPGNFDRDEMPYPRVLEKLLRAQHPGRDVEVLPLACPGYTSGQGLAWLRRDIARLRPDIVIACFGWNNVRAAGLPDVETMPQSATQVALRRLIGDSQLLLHVVAGVQSTSAPAALRREPRSTAEDYVAHFLEMNALCSANGAWFGIVLPVYRAGDDVAEAVRMTLYRDELRSSAASREIPALLIPELTESGPPQSAQLFGDPIHPNAAGHELMAERIAEFLAEPVAQRLGESR